MDEFPLLEYGENSNWTIWKDKLESGLQKKFGVVASFIRTNVAYQKSLPPYPTDVHSIMKAKSEPDPEFYAAKERLRLYQKQTDAIMALNLTYDAQ